MKQETKERIKAIGELVKVVIELIYQMLKLVAMIYILYLMFTTDLVKDVIDAILSNISR